MSHKKQSSFPDIPPSPTTSENPTLVLQEPSGKELVVMFQCGLEKEAFVFEARDLAAVKEQACIFLETKVKYFYNKNYILLGSQILPNITVSNLGKYWWFHATNITQRTVLCTIYSLY